MVYPVAAGTPSYGSGSASKFIPQIWSGKLVEKFYDTTVFNEIANTDYEGEIKAQGDSVVIRTVPKITIHNYVKGQGLERQRPESPSVELKIDKGKYFNFECFEIDKHQSDQNLMDDWSTDGGEQMQIEVDSDILAGIPSQAASENAGSAAGRVSQRINLGTAGTPLAVTKENILDVLVDFGTVLDEQSVPQSNRWVVLPAIICALIKKGDLKDASLAGDSTSIIRNGRHGMVDRFTIYNSNNVNYDAGSGEFDVVFGHKSALTFASQITHMKVVDNQDDFGELVRSLFVFGYEVIKPESLGHAVLSI